MHLPKSRVVDTENHVDSKHNSSESERESLKTHILGSECESPKIHILGSEHKPLKARVTDKERESQRACILPLKTAFWPTNARP